MHEEIRSVRDEVGALRTELNARFDGMQRTMVLGFASIVASAVGAILAGTL